MPSQVEDYSYRLLVNVIALVKRTLLIMLLYSLVRLIFLIFNYNYFQPFDYFELCKVFFFGLRFDYAVIFYLNILFVLIHFVPGKFQFNKKFQKALKIFFVTVNGIIIIPAFIDVTYFEFINKRSSIDLIRLFMVSKDVVGLVPLFFIDYWHMTLFWIMSVGILWIMYPNLKLVNIRWPLASSNICVNKVIVTCLVPLYLAISMVIARGTELKPLRIISAIDYVKADYTPLLLNTPFVMINTIDHQDINVFKYFTPEEACQKFNVLKKIPVTHEQKRPLNVVIIILESFSKEYVGFLNNGEKSYTPFIDSLARESYCFTNAFANGKRSIEALPAILGSFPPLTEDPLISTKYSTNKQSSLPLLLKRHGYNASFFHGGTNGTMGFDKYCASIGIEKYFGKNEYHGNGDDGHWGIFDEEFFQFYVEKLNTFSQPFFSSFFSLTSHHPYPIPEKYKDIFKGGELPIHPTIEYTDFALKKFFNTASKTNWFNNTLFVITADHTAQAVNSFYQNRVGNYCIPILFYWPGNSNFKGKDAHVAQQTDIFPSIVHLLGIDDAFVSFGNDLFSDTERFSVNLYKRTYQYITDDYALVFDGERTHELYRYKADSLLTTNLSGSLPDTVAFIEDKLKALLQTYTSRISSNRLADTTILFQ